MGEDLVTRLSPTKILRVIRNEPWLIATAYAEKLENYCHGNNQYARDIPTRCRGEIGHCAVGALLYRAGVPDAQLLTKAVTSTILYDHFGLREGEISFLIQINDHVSVSSIRGRRALVLRAVRFLAGYRERQSPSRRRLPRAHGEFLGIMHAWNRRYPIRSITQ